MRNKKSIKFFTFYGKNFEVSVLQGTTGSGKTIVYFKRIRKLSTKKTSFSFTTRDFLTMNQDKISRFFLVLNLHYIQKLLQK